MRRILVLTAVAVVLAANAWSLVATWRNRNSPSGGTLELTEREVRLAHVPWESTAMLLELHWDARTDSPRGRRRPAWLDATKLTELGFDCTVPVGSPNAEEHYSSLPSVPVFLVLEYEGDAWRRASKVFEPETRLFVVDAGLDGRRLRGRYADTKRHVITRGVVRLSYQKRSTADGTLYATPRLEGWIESVLPSEIFVPQPYSRSLEEFRQRGPPTRDAPKGKPRFAVTVSWGSNYEPWVHGVRRLTAESPE